MKYPMINKQPRREVTVPSLSGGLNLRDGITGVRDNQLTDCVNMWFKDGMLRTRPSINVVEDCYWSFFDFDEHGNAISYDTHGIKCHNEIKDISGKTLVSFYSANLKMAYYKIRFYWIGAEGLGFCGHLTVSLGDSTQENNRKYGTMYSDTSIGNGYFVIEKDGCIYVFVHFCGEYFCKKLEYEKYGVGEFKTMDELDDFYAPLVIVEDKQMRGYNLLGGRYKGRYEFNTGEEKTKYNLPMPIPKNSKVRIWVSAASAGEAIYEFTSDDATEEITKDLFGGKLKIKVVRAAQSYIEFLNSSGEAISKIGDISGISLLGGYFDYNSVCDVSKDMHKVFGMQQQIYYGAGAEGISGGTRLVLGANRAGKERNLVMWSGLNNPLYWPENNCAYIGDKTQAVTGFALQGEYLIVFKEKSSYYAYGNTNTEITSDDIIDQTVIDLEASASYFAFVLFNGHIGCNLPNTIALCRNRLVWTCKDGNVYTMVSNNQYSERTIFKVSDMIEPRLSKEKTKAVAQNVKAMEIAYGFDCGDHYCLVIDNRMYVMDYNSYGFQYIASFSKTEDSNVQIPWYYWELPSMCKKDESEELDYNDGVHMIMQTDGHMMFISYDATDYDIAIAGEILDFENTAGEDSVRKYEKKLMKSYINTSKIDCSMTTKLFDFGASRHVKNIEGVSVAFGNNGGVPIGIEFVTNVGNEADTVTLNSPDVDEREAAFVTIKNLYPSSRAVRTFGAKISCSGNLFIDGISLQYRLLGGAK